ncbi:MAG: cupin domain-containing protein [Dechloromonas sp.]|nr:cupin domain-containing protein [Dechloromonas sp.]
MNRTRTTNTPRCLLASFLVATSLGVGAQAPGMPQTPGFQSKPIQSAPVSGDDSKEMHAIAVSIAPGGYSPAHVHPGDCLGTVIEGTVDLVADGKETRRVGPGEAFSNPRGTVHQFRNSGEVPVRMLTFVVVDKGKPRVMPPPEPAK